MSNAYSFLFGIGLLALGLYFGFNERRPQYALVGFVGAFIGGGLVCLGVFT